MDSNQVSRRNFFCKAGIVGAAIVAPVVTTVVVTMPEAKKEIEDISHLKPESDLTFVLQGNKKPQKSPLPGEYSSFVMTNEEYLNKVHMSVGKDNRLWIKADGKWRRVALDPDWCNPTYCDPAQV
jgi:hypothetical protein